MKLLLTGNVKAFVLAMLAAVVLFPMQAHAGRNCVEAPADAAKTQKGIRFAKQVRESMELTGANIALLGRVGSDQSKRGVRFTHVGFLFREHPAGAWTVVHELNTCGSGNSDLYDEGLANFFMDDPFDYETRIIVPSQALQEKLGQILLSPLKRGMHESSYSAIANPWSTKHQNSNGWALEILAAAASDGQVYNRETAQRWLRDNGYRPSRIHIGGGERAGARLFTPNIRFGDHPDSGWQTQMYEVSTGDATLEFFRQYDRDARLITQRLDARPVVAQKAAVEPRPVPTNPVADSGGTAGMMAPAVAPMAAIVDTSTPGLSRGQLLQSMQGLIVPYACRSQGYLSQCRQMENSVCGKQVADAVLRCFATVSDQQLTGGNEQAMMQQMRDIGYCAVESVDANLRATGKRPPPEKAQNCQSVRSYKQ